MEYLQNTSLCVDSSKQSQNVTFSNVSPNGHYYDSASTALKHQRSRQSTSLISPVTRLLKSSAALVNNTVLHLRDGLTEEQRMAKIKLEERRQILHLRLKNATNLHDWKTAARDLDILTGNESWKASPESADFDAPLVEKRLQELDEARINCDVTRMLYLVRTALSRDIGGMGNISLYKNSYIGTKNLIERYIDSALETIRSLVKIATSNVTLPNGMETKDVLEQVVYARQAFGRSALLLSGGATFGMNHVGVLKALFEAHMLPRIISGASAGSIVAAVLCTRTDEELPQVLRDFPYGNLAVFEEEGREDTILERIRRFLTEGAWIDIRFLTGVMQELLGDLTFQEAYNRSRRILNICVSSASAYDLPRLLNYITSPNVMIWSAVAASCSVPLIFSAAPLLAKNPITGEHHSWDPTPQKWIDGSVDNDLPMTRLAEMFNVNHFIVSQVNPHVIPFLTRDEESISHLAQPSSSSWDPTSVMYTLTNLAKGEALHRLHVLAEMGIFPNMVTKARSVLSQKYSGDITILPEIDFGDIPRMLKNPTTEFMCRTCLAGERATWPKLSRVRNHCAVELELDHAVQQLRARVVFSPSQVDLRRLSNGAGMISGGITRSSTIRGRSRRDSGSRLFDNASPQRKIGRPPVWRAASHYGGPLRRNPSVVELTLGPDLSSSNLELTSPSHLMIPRGRNTSKLHGTFNSSMEPNNGKQDRDSSASRSPAARRTISRHFPNAAADYFSGIESEVTQGEESMSPISRVHDSSDSENGDVDSHTDTSSPEPDINTINAAVFPSSIPRNDDHLGRGSLLNQDPAFLFAHQPSTPSGGAAGVGGISSAPVLSPLLSREQWRAQNRRDEGVESRTEPSSPERRYKRLFHPPVSRD